MSYEVCITVLGIPLICFFSTFRFGIISWGQTVFFRNYAPHAVLICLIVMAWLRESGRPPFDLPEAEAELVAGYQTEYGSISFVILFLREYVILVLWSNCVSLLFFSG